MVAAFRLLRLAFVVVAVTLIVLIKLDPRPGIVTVPGCPTDVGGRLVDLCQHTPSEVPLEIGSGGIPVCTGQQLALVAPGFEPVNCRRP